MNISLSKEINKTLFEIDLQVYGALEGCSMTLFAVKFARQRRSSAACWKSEGPLLLQNISFVHIALVLILLFLRVIMESSHLLFVRYGEILLGK